MSKPVVRLDIILANELAIFTPFFVKKFTRVSTGKTKWQGFQNDHSNKYPISDYSYQTNVVVVDRWCPWLKSVTWFKMTANWLVTSQILKTCPLPVSKGQLWRIFLNIGLSLVVKLNIILSKRTKQNFKFNSTVCKPTINHTKDNSTDIKSIGRWIWVFLMQILKL